VHPYSVMDRSGEASYTKVKSSYPSNGQKPDGLLIQIQVTHREVLGVVVELELGQLIAQLVHLRVPVVPPRREQALDLADQAGHRICSTRGGCACYRRESHARSDPAARGCGGNPRRSHTPTKATAARSISQHRFTADDPLVLKNERCGTRHPCKGSLNRRLLLPLMMNTVTRSLGEEGLFTLGSRNPPVRMSLRALTLPLSTTACRRA
jgi:hypothetical protein